MMHNYIIYIDTDILYNQDSNKFIFKQDTVHEIIGNIKKENYKIYSINYSNKLIHIKKSEFFFKLIDRKNYAIKNPKFLLEKYIDAVDKNQLNLLQISQFIQWTQENIYCTKCSAKLPNTISLINAEKKCNKCNYTSYPYIANAIMVAIKKDNKILLARSKNFKTGLYGLIAGFINPGETAEIAVKREVKEEVGLEIKNILYFGTQSWPFGDRCFIIAFTADYDSGEINLQTEELEHANWFSSNNLPQIAHNRNIANKLIKYTLNSIKN